MNSWLVLKADVGNHPSVGEEHLVSTELSASLVALSSLVLCPSQACAEANCSAAGQGRPRCSAEHKGCQVRGKRAEKVSVQPDS